MPNVLIKRRLQVENTISRVSYFFQRNNLKILYETFFVFHRRILNKTVRLTIHYLVVWKVSFFYRNVFYTNMIPNLSKVMIFILIEQHG